MSDREIHVCRKCQEKVQPNATKCPHCGYQAVLGGVMTSMQAASYFMLAGTLVITVIGIPLAPRVWRKAKERSKLSKELGSFSKKVGGDS